MADSPLKTTPLGSDSDDCMTRTLEGTAFSVFFGSLLGAFRSNWKDMTIPKGSSFTLGLQKTGTAMLKYGIFLGGVGLLYSSTECFMEKTREKKDIYNGFYGGLAAGLACGVHTRSAKIGAASSLALGLMSFAVEATGHSLKGEGLKFDKDLKQRETYSPTVRID